jgi:ABC-type nitrate/sulfonate/bicarbonate transport system permease component
MEREEELLEQAVVRLNAKLLGIVLGFLMGLGLFLATNYLILKGGPNVGLHLNLLGQFFPGYTVTFVGSLIGFVYAFVVGYLIGYVIGAVYNKVARV